MGCDREDYWKKLHGTKQLYVRDRFTLIAIKFHPPFGAWEVFRAPWINYCDLPEHARKKMHLPEPEWQGWKGQFKPGSD